MVFPSITIGFPVVASIKIPLSVYSVPSFNAFSATLSVMVTFSFAPTTWSSVSLLVAVVCTDGKYSVCFSSFRSAWTATSLPSVYICSNATVVFPARETPENLNVISIVPFGFSAVNSFDAVILFPASSRISLPVALSTRVPVTEYLRPTSSPL